ncbi:MAG: thioesterase [Paludibacteraceae bacterium]|nr:thioesterase [Paludibacteraceae bacterium]
MHSEYFTVYHVDCDRNGLLKTDVFQEMILNTACRAAEIGGFGIPELNRQGRTWVLARYQQHTISSPRIGDKLRIDTWIEMNRMAFSMRNFRAFRVSDDGVQTLLAEATSAWAVIDIHSRENVNFNDIPHYPEPEGGSVDLPRLPRPDRKGEAISSTHRIVYSDLDQNGHCNSSRYLQIMIDSLDEIDGIFPSDLQVSYSHEIFFGETVTIKHTVKGSPFFAIYNQNGTLCVTAQFLLPNL